jgi:hypothetical protein
MCPRLITCILGLRKGLIRVNLEVNIRNKTIWTSSNQVLSINSTRWERGIIELSKGK